MANFGGPLEIKLARQNGRFAPLAKVQLWEYENQTLEAFVASRRLYAMFDCAVARQNLPLLATAHDCETGLFKRTILFLWEDV